MTVDCTGRIRSSLETATDRGRASMDLGLVLQTTPPSARVVDLAKRAETYGFSHVWTFDSHILWQEPYVIYSQILAETRNIVVGPMVTNPATRDWTVTASVFATLNEMYGNRTVCGIGRGDSAVRVTNGKPTTIDTLRESVHVIRELANGRSVEYKGSTITLPVGGAAASSRCGSPATGRRRWRWPARSATGSSSSSPTRRSRRGRSRRCARRPSKPAATPTPITICVAAPGLRRRRRRPHARDQCRWFGGMVGNHVADIVGRYGESSDVPAALTDYIKGRQGYDYNEHGQAGNAHAEFVPDEIVDRFCILGPVDEHAAPARRAARARRRPVRRLPPARRQGRHAAGLRRARHPGARRARPSAKA